MESVIAKRSRAFLIAAGLGCVLSGAVAAGAAGSPKVVALGAKAAATAAPRRWLGVAVEHIPATMSRLLGLRADQGLLVDAVLPNSPASLAEIRVHDLLYSVNGRKLLSRRQLLSAADAVGARGGAVVCKLGFIRDGRRFSVRLMPRRRPAAFMTSGGPTRLDVALTRTGLTRWKPMHLMVRGRTMDVGPGIVLPMSPKSMSEVSVQVRKVPGQTLLVLQRTDAAGRVHSVLQVGAERYRVTPKTVGKLPVNLRPLGLLICGRKPGVVVMKGIFQPAPPPAKVNNKRREMAVLAAQLKALRLQTKTLEARLKADRAAVRGEGAKRKPG